MDVFWSVCELHSHFSALQTDVDHQVAAVESLMGSIVRIMLGRGPKASEGNSVEGKVMAATVEATKISCIRAIKEYINFCHRLKVLPLHLEDIEVSTPCLAKVNASIAVT